MPSHASEHVNAISSGDHSVPTTPRRGRSRDVEPTRMASTSSSSPSGSPAFQRRHTSQALLNHESDTDDLIATESTPLLAPSLSDQGSRTPWNDSVKRLKRRSARLSDMLSRGAHSAFAKPGGIDEEDELAGDDDRRSVFSAKLLDGYDGEFKRELESSGGAGIRVWYENFHGIDWLHDQLKNGLRMKRLRKRKETDGLRGRILNLWDGFQGWLLVTIIGAVTAVFAFAIIRSEGWLFDLKDGFCRDSFFKSKRFCCPPEREMPSARLLSATLQAVPAHGVHSGFKQTWRAPAEDCERWVSWYDAWPLDSTARKWLAAHGMYVGLALLFAGTASTMAIFLSSSASVFSSKDSPSAPYPGFDPSLPVGKGCDDPRQHALTGTTRKTMYFAAGSGIPEIKAILSGLVIRGYLGTWTLVTKSVGLCLSVASGLSLGKEGPFVHIASCVGNIASRFFPKFDLNEAKRREILSAACAAGVSVSFGAPIGGTLFSLEEVSYYFPPRVMWRSFWCAMIAAASLRFLDPFGSGKIVLFAVTYDREWHFFELIGFALLGVFGGLYGAAFCKANIWWTRHIRNGTALGRHPILEVLLVTLVTALVSYSNIFTRMGGTELVFELFSECHREDSFDGLCVTTPNQVFGLIGHISTTWIIKALLTIVTFGIKVPAGIFIPSLAVGACFGRIAGLLVEYLYAFHPSWTIFDGCRTAFQDGPQPFGQACVLPGVWAMVGAASTLSGVTKTTVSLAVIMFELTGTLSYVVPVMLAVLVAKTVGDALEPRSIYDLVIELSNLPYLDDKTEYLHDSKPTDIMDTDALTICLDDDNTLDSLRHKLAKMYRECNGAGFPIIGRDEDDKSRLYGYISSKELEHGLAAYSLLPLTTPVTFHAAVAVRHGVLPTRRASRLSTPAGCDLSWLIETAPLIINDQAPMELCHEIFAKLGSRYMCVIDAHGFYKGVIERNRYLGYLQWLEKRK